MSEQPWTSGPWELRGNYVCIANPSVAPEDDDTPPLVDIETWGARHADGQLIALAPDMAAAILAWDASVDGTETHVDTLLQAAADRLRGIGGNHE